MFKARIQYLFGVVLLLAGTGASAVPLLDLLNNPSLQVINGDKIFTNFRNYQSNASGANASPVDAARIDVAAYTAFDGELGLQFWDDLTNPQFAIGPQSGQGTVFDYDVITTGAWIHDNTLNMGGLQVRTASGVGSVQPPTSVNISEQVFDALANPLAFKQVYFEIGLPLKTGDHATFAPQSWITINTDIGLLTGVDSQVRFSTITQTFSQVPEPATLALLGLGLAGIVLMRRKTG